MKKPEDKLADSGRRKFLHGAAGAGVGAAVVSAVPVAAVAATDDKAADNSPEGYRLTQHILDYYKTASS